MAFPAPYPVQANGIELAVYEQGQGFPVVFCHGFPELAWSWRHQLPALAAAGYRAIAPDMRGYGASGRPAAVEAYDVHHLTGDLVGLLDALGIDKAVFCGHDWGGSVVWAMPLLHPQRVAGLIGVNTPFLPRPPTDPVAYMRATFGEDMYMVVFQQPGRAEAILEADVEKTLRFLFRRGRVPAAEMDSPEGRRRGLGWTLALERSPAVPPGPLVMPEEELQVYVETFRRTGFTGGLNWYRNLTRNWETTADLPHRVPHPSLMVTAADDFVLRPSMADGMPRYFDDLTRHDLADCGHWTQCEQPQALNRVLLDWLRPRFG